jgi:hypothetical protein
MNGPPSSGQHVMTGSRCKSTVEVTFSVTGAV